MKFCTFFFQFFLSGVAPQRPLIGYSEMSVLPEVWADDCDKQAKALSVILAVKEWRVHVSLTSLNDFQRKLTPL